MMLLVHLNKKTVARPPPASPQPSSFQKLRHTMSHIMGIWRVFLGRQRGVGGGGGGNE
jgi:hypothetical protein